MKTTVKYLLILTAIMLLVQNQSFYAQNLKKVFKYIEKAEIDKAELEMKEYTEEIKKSAVDYTIYIIAGTIITSNDKSQSYDPYKSLEMFEEISRIDANKTEVDEFLLNYNYSEDKVHELIFQNILKEAKKLNTESSYRKALSVCKKCFYEQEVIKLKEIAAYNEVKNQKSILDYKTFIRNYPSSEFKKEIQELLEELAFSEAKTIMTEQAMNEYMKEYSDNQNKWLSKSIHLRDSIAYSKLNKTYFEYLAFSKKYPKSEFTFQINEELPNLLYDQAQRDESIKLYKLFVDEYPADKRIDTINAKLEEAYFENLKSEISLIGFENFKKRYQKSKYFDILNEFYLKLLSKNGLKKEGLRGKVKSTKTKNNVSQGYVIDYQIDNFDIFGQLTETKLNNGFSVFFTYDDNGNRQESNANIEGIIHTSKYIYDEKRNLIFIYHYKDGKLDESDKDEFKYDQNNNKIWNAGSGYEITYKYDTCGYIIEQLTKDLNKYIYKSEIIYDKNRNEVEVDKTTIAPSGAESKNKIINKYDKWGNQIESKITASKGYVGYETTTYIYDNMGNWIKKTRYVDGKMSNFWERIIEYY